MEGVLIGLLIGWTVAAVVRWVADRLHDRRTLRYLRSEEYAELVRRTGL